MESFSFSFSSSSSSHSTSRSARAFISILAFTAAGGSGIGFNGLKSRSRNIYVLSVAMFNGKDSYGAIGLGSGARTLASVCFDVRSAASAARRASSNAARSAR